MRTLLSKEWRLLLFGFLMTFWSSPGQTFFIALLGGDMRADLALSHGEYGAIYSLATLLSASALIFTGALIDKVALNKFSVIAIFGLVVGCWMMSITTGVISLLIAVFLIRQMGQGLMYMISATTMVRYFHDHRGKASALSGMGYAVSEAVMPSIVIALSLAVGWRMSWQIFAVALVVLMAALIPWLLKGHDLRHQRYLDSMTETPQGMTTAKRQWRRREVIRDKRFYLFMPGLMSQPLMFTGFIFHQIHLVEQKSWSLTAWGALFSFYAIISVLAKIVTGFWVDRYGAVKLVSLIAIPMGFGFLILYGFSSLYAAVGFLTLTGITVGFQTTVSGPFWSELYGTRYLGSIKSLATATMVFSSALSPVVIGWFIDQGTTIETLSLGAAVYIFLTSGLALITYLRLVRNKD